ncbi:hypothetical protein M9H77_00913 [Catharanthus roseus]|uniref:Uncharacterized protein n=1 Tax=Catharanthus roseus TaxID=4058 RepID=A0ACC0C452_CATRO|nr:hypothetical protein M9H77_00913 [Catharanthus roseus]
MSQLVNHVACIKSHHPRCEKFFCGPVCVPTHETYATPSTRHKPAANSRPWGHFHTITTEMLTGEAMSGQASTSKEKQKPPLFTHTSFNLEGTTETPVIYSCLRGKKNLSELFFFTNNRSRWWRRRSKPVENCSESLLLIIIIICCCCFNKRECRSTE